MFKCDGFRRRRKAERPAEILEAAFDAFAARGYAATRLEDVAARAGVTKGTIYLYFSTKEKLFEEMVRSHSAGLLADADAILGRIEGASANRLRGFLRFLYGRCVTDRRGREILRFMIADGKSFPHLVAEHYRDFVLPLLGMVSGLVDQGVAAGEFRADLPRETVRVVIAPTLFLSVIRLIFGDAPPVDEEAYVDAHIELAMTGLLAAPT
ncbi:transcriptional regulator, TetR family [Rhodoblastus acidophilus]|uniref:Transcriptional regulator, TetR family n=1 Tax=Rhodoblastus acidophilus TaxID=1074 RepID=A0A212R3I2_RHOAC|nr:TetR/AcrR family transcriptional regulator [Rhodoblastus acidophilus]PPQ40243.1 TetR family transcriptional regulator [Rhodoblastus acidophilus]RAI18145.1 TetR family transcriptional regulator [Rhodoblastus acidophilus]SNB66594.1 transcriptional regulator, TetR family [Rhodoblastus acidophilus]